MTFQTLLFNLDQRIAHITINRPKALNALNTQVMQELSKLFDQLQTTLSDMDGVIIDGAGDKAFVAGADITEFTSLSAAEGESKSSSGHALFFKIENFPKPVVAVIDGFCLGGGCELAMACHMRIATDNARFGQPEVNLGLLPGYGATQRLVQLIGKAKALELLLTADMIKADQALELGLVNHIWSTEEVMSNTKKLIHKIAGKGPLAVAAVIEAVNAGIDPSMNGYAVEARLFGHLLSTDDAREGATAFLEKRKPEFKGR